MKSLPLHEPDIRCGTFNPEALQAIKPQIPVYRRFGRLLRELRQRDGLTIGHIARRLGRSSVYVSECERGVRPMHLDDLFNLVPLRLNEAARGPIYWELASFPTEAYVRSALGDQNAMFRAAMGKGRILDEAACAMSRAHHIAPLSFDARTLVDGAYRELTGMHLPCNDYYFPEALTEAIECAEALGL